MLANVPDDEFAYYDDGSLFWSLRRGLRVIFEGCRGNQKGPTKMNGSGNNISQLGWCRMYIPRSLMRQVRTLLAVERRYVFMYQIRKTSLM